MKPAHSPVSNRAADPAPQPPSQPDLEDCCRSGCTPCVLEVYQDALDRYERDLKAWQTRHPGADTAAHG